MQDAPDVRVGADPLGHEMLGYLPLRRYFGEWVELPPRDWWGWIVGPDPGSGDHRGSGGDCGDAAPAGVPGAPQEPRRHDCDPDRPEREHAEDSGTVDQRDGRPGRNHPRPRQNNEPPTIMNLLSRFNLLTRFVRGQTAEIAEWMVQKNRQIDRIERDAEQTRNEVQNLTRYHDQQQQRGTQ